MTTRRRTKTPSIVACFRVSVAVSKIVVSAPIETLKSKALEKCASQNAYLLPLHSFVSRSNCLSPLKMWSNNRAMVPHRPRPELCRLWLSFLLADIHSIVNLQWEMADFRWGKFKIAIRRTLKLNVEATWCEKIKVEDPRENDRFNICRENVDFRYGWGYFRLRFGWDSSWLSQICRACWAITLAPLEGEEFIFAGS